MFNTSRLVRFLPSIISTSFLFSFTLMGLQVPSANAKPCGHTWFDRLGCAIDPTNPKENGGIVKPVIVEPVIQVLTPVAREVSCVTVGAVSASAVTALGAVIVQPGVVAVSPYAGMAVSGRCYMVWEEYR